MEAEVAGIRGDAPFDVIVGHFVSMGGECVLMDPDMVCGRDHVLSALIHAERAFSEGTNRSRTLPTEIIMYCAWERQIGKAVSKMSPKEGRNEYVALVLGVHDLRLDEIGMTRDDSLIAATPEKASALGLDDPFLSFEDQAVENVAAVELLKQRSSRDSVRERPADLRLQDVQVLRASGGQDRPARLVVERGAQRADAPARLLQDHGGRRIVPGTEPGLEEEVSGPLRQHAQLNCGGADPADVVAHGVQTLGDLEASRGQRLVVCGPRGEEQAVPQRTPLGFYGNPVLVRSDTFLGAVEGSIEGIVDDSRERLPVLHQGHGDPDLGNPPGEVGGPVDRVDDPRVSVPEDLRVVALLPFERRTGYERGQLPPQEALVLHVHRRHKVLLGPFHADREALSAAYRDAGPPHHFRYLRQHARPNHGNPINTARRYTVMAYEMSEELKNDMIMLQRKVVDEGLAVLVVFEGRNERVQESIINEFLNLIDPRIATYSHFTAEGMRDSREIFKTMSHEPAKGKIAVYDRSWYSWIDPSVSDHSGLFMLIEELERYFADNGVILIKFFLDSDEVRKSVPEGWMTGPKGTFLSDDHKYEVWGRKSSSKIISGTTTAYAPWDVVKVDDVLKSSEVVCRTFIDRVEGRVKSGYPRTKESVVPLYDNPREGLDLSLTASKYSKKLLKLSEELNRLQAKLASSGLSLVVLFEGWDAAGKGGSIKRVTRALNPRGYYVNPVAAPTKEEGLHTYLWRFATKMPKAGHISIYDRSWYGRMMVEPIEKFCTEEEYGRSAREIRTFEKVLSNSGCIILKFWMEISPDEQLRRFNARAEDPTKQYKITDEDWRNREKWDVYEEYIDRMLAATNTQYAPWIAVESEDKKYGRLKVLKSIVDALSERLD